ncbi:ComEA family DNA-binding protein [Daejeonella lutea]|uniref:DNA uptake protein ComE n=1 Tax=Daejeonella lutea TaxID=572036 RepID=A0A1T4ZZE9_9SPHI|nr:helix-hairpin-helix domain-containing protein [Daejeonella lutea]SKB27879.1 DNA uptake protein ComE [Daejeonella lutea]
MKKQVTSYFSFSKKELNGILVLLGVIMMSLSFSSFYGYFDEPETYDLTSFQKEIALFRASAVERKKGYTFLKDKIEDREMEPEYFEFDPNTASVLDWKKLGLSAKQIKILNNYRSKGGKFFKKEDLKRIYSITEKQFDGLEPYIKIKFAAHKPFSERKLPASPLERTKKEVIIIELNSADSVMLDQLRGIGPAFASRIIRFRNRLGGFHNKEQVKEVYGMDSLRYALISNQIKIDASSLRKVSINTATFEDLRNHPYLNFKQINAIIHYRKQHGKYSSSADLKKVLILNEEIIRKIEPYLSFDP